MLAWCPVAYKLFYISPLHDMFSAVISIVRYYETLLNILFDDRDLSSGHADKLNIQTCCHGDAELEMCCNYAC